MKSVMFISCLVLMMLTACENGPDDQNGMAGDPTDLVVNILISDNGSGLVQVSASANNAAEYQFFMGDSNELTATSVEGQYDHTYGASGSYIVEVRAVGTTGRFLRFEERITVDAGGEDVTGVGFTSPLEYPGMELVWSDEFNGTTLNAGNWSHDIGDGCPSICGWGNNELEYYTTQNHWLDNGVLTIEAREQAINGKNFSSTKILTRDKQAFLYGRLDIRAQLPFGQGMWPAIWMLGTNFNQVGWPASGEIDIMEMIGGNGREKEVHGTVHWQQNGDRAQIGDDFELLSGNFNDEFHVFSLIWEEREISWLVDDRVYFTLDTSSPTFDAFRRPFYMILNVAVGGNWPGNPNASTPFPNRMLVDYVRYFQEV